MVASCFFLPWLVPSYTLQLIAMMSVLKYILRAFEDTASAKVSLLCAGKRKITMMQVKERSLAVIPQLHMQSLPAWPGPCTIASVQYQYPGMVWDCLSTCKY